MAEIRRIFLRNFAVEASIGIHDFERAARQRVLVNVELTVSASAWGQGDDIRSVLDYDFIRRGVAALAADRHFNLQETFCAAIAALVDRPEVAALRVSTEKTEVYPDCDGVGYEITRTRD